jgi:hypothetical protein
MRYILSPLLALALALGLVACTEDEPNNSGGNNVNNADNNVNNADNNVNNADNNVSNADNNVNNPENNVNNPENNVNNPDNNANNPDNNVNNNPADVQDPVVAFTRPSEGDELEGLAPVELTASDDVGVARVAILVDGAEAVAFDTPPYTWAWDTAGVEPGPHTLEAVAADAAGNEARVTVSVTVKAPNTAPTLSISAPQADSFLTGSAIFSAEVEDAEGVEKVEFYAGEALLSADDSAPYSVLWDTTTAPDGAQTLRAVVTDLGGLTAEASVSVQVDNTAPTVTVAAPLADALVGDVLPVSATASDASGVVGVVAEVGDVQLALAGDPWGGSLDLSSLPSGSHTLSVTATDIVGLTGAAEVEIVLDRAPTVEFVGLLDGATVEGPVEVEVNALDDLGVLGIEFFVDGTSQGQFDEGRFAWTPDYAPAQRTLRAVVTDSAGQQAEASVNVSVNHPVEVKLSRCTGLVCEPLLGGETLLAAVTVRAEVRDDDGAPTRVQFFAGNQAIGSDNAAPYEIVWNTRGLEGSRALRAVATGAGGQTGEQSVQVTVEDCDGDNDGSEQAACGGDDCDDTRTAVSPGAEELCNELDDNCDGQVDEDAEGLCVGDRTCVRGICVRPTFCATEGATCNESTAANDQFACVAGDTTRPTALSCHVRCVDDTNCTDGSFCLEVEGVAVCARSNCTSPLNAADECANAGVDGGTCFAERNGAFYCSAAGEAERGESCEVNGDCAVGLTCVDNRCSPFCGDDNDCGQEECVFVLGNDDFGVCGQGCPGFDTFDECADGTGCFPVTPDEGICIERGETPVGDECVTQEECVPFSSCSQLDTSLPQTCTAWCDLTLAQPDRECDAGQICIGVGGAEFPHIGGCFDGCTPFATPAGTGCGQDGVRSCIPQDDAQQRGVCYLSGAIPLGQACTLVDNNSFGQCAPGSLCVPDAQGDQEGTCTKMCRTFSSVNNYDSGCPNGQICALVGEGDWGFCQAPPQPIVAHNTACTLTGDYCNDEAFCFDLSGSSLGNLCLNLCRLSVGDADCPVGNGCLDAIGNVSLGLCYPR